MGLPLLESNRQTHEGLPVDVSYPAERARLVFNP